MRRRSLPLASRIRARLSGRRTIFDCAQEVVELGPGDKRSLPPTISLPGEYDRVVGFNKETTAAEEFKRVFGRESSNWPTLAYRIDNAILAKGSLYFRGGHDTMRSDAEKFFLHDKPDHFGEAQLCTNYVVERYFGHWVNDGLLLELLAEQRSMPGLSFTKPAWLHEPGYRAILDIPLYSTSHACIDRLWVIDDSGTSANRVARFQEMRRRARAIKTNKGPKRVMLTRGVLGVPRELSNNDEVVEALEKAQFRVVNPEQETPAQIIQLLADAEIVVLVEGSAQNHCLLAMPAGSTLLTIQPAAIFNAFSKTLTDAVGLRWAFVVADRDENRFRLSIPRLLQTIDAIESVMARSPVNLATG